MTKEDVLELSAASKDTCGFFSYICQYMLFYMIYASLKMSFYYVSLDPERDPV